MPSPCRANSGSGTTKPGSGVPRASGRPLWKWLRPARARLRSSRASEPSRSASCAMPRSASAGHSSRSGCSQVTPSQCTAGTVSSRPWSSQPAPMRASCRRCCLPCSRRSRFARSSRPAARACSFRWVKTTRSSVRCARANRPRSSRRSCPTPQVQAARTPRSGLTFSRPALPRMPARNCAVPTSSRCLSFRPARPASRKASCTRRTRCVSPSRRTRGSSR